MAEKRKRPGRGFWLGAAVYALVFLAAAGLGLRAFWSYMESYEKSRPQNAVDAYLAQLTPEHIADSCAGLYEKVDTNIQSVEQCRACVCAALDQSITCTKSLKEGSEDRQVYTLRCGSRIIGSFTLSSTGKDKNGFSQWAVTGEQFDLDYLMAEPVTVTVPDSFTVRLNGRELDESYRQEGMLEYPLLEEFYGKYPLPGLVVYQADDLLGPVTMEALDPEGAVVELTPQTDFESWLDNCSQEEIQQIRELCQEFLVRYTRYCGGAWGTHSANAAALWKCLVPEGELKQRLFSALSGLQFAQSNGDTVGEITFHHFIRLEDGRYFCSFTYELTTIGRKGPVETLNNMKLILLPTDQGLRVEDMQSF